MANMATGQKVQVGSGSAVSVSSNAMYVVDRTPLIMMSSAASVSTGTVKATAGNLLMIVGTTTGDMQLMDGTTLVQRPRITANSIVTYTWPGLPFATSISISASAAVGHIVYV